MSGVLHARAPADWSEFERLVTRRQPVLFGRAVADWPAVGRWSLAYLTERLATCRIPMEVYPDGDYCRSWLSYETTGQRFAELLGESNAPERYYLAEVRLSEICPELSSDFSPPRFLDPSRLIYNGAFIGRDTITGLHYHPTNQAILCQVTGVKEVVLYPPDDYRLLYFEPFYSHRFNFSRASFPGTDHRAFPKISRATALSVKLDPGDALFIPMHWPHVVLGRGESISVTFFWKSRVADWRPTPATGHAIVGHAFRAGVTRPLARLLAGPFGYRVTW